jgi:hypothetical protein
MVTPPTLALDVLDIELEGFEEDREVFDFDVVGLWLLDTGVL